ncbi:MAG TPA: DUF2267 domain-containing protein [Acidimicrobiales bacterium]|nr:DUF2267 domain-containing protein [Acidimicrobiales bacterium]
MAGRTLRLTGLTLVVATVSWLMWLFLPERARPRLHRMALRAGRELRYWGGRVRGLGYHLAGRHPDPNVSDTALADRVRSSLGPLEKRLDMPRVHVDVEGHVVRLHGEVPSRQSGRLVEQAVQRIAGVRGVESYLQVAPITAGERPSGGRIHPGASQAYKRLVEAAFNAGAPAEVAPRVVRAVLAFLADRVPASEFDQLASHLPADVRAVCVAPARRGAHPRRVRKVQDLVAGLATATEPLPPDQAEHVIESVLGALRDLVPEEDLDIAAVLPDELRDFWLSAMSH